MHFSVNLLDDGSVRSVDWEFAGMGDIYFDLATLVFAAMWGVLHCGLQMAGVHLPVEGFDYLECAQYVFGVTLKAV